MIVYKEPIVSVVSYPIFQEPTRLACEWIGESTNAERLMEYAGRVCYMSQANPAKRTTRDYLANILTQAHGSVLEHANITLLFEGISRSLTHELVRHRAGFAYSQLSQRYVNSTECGIVMPPRIQALPEKAQSTWIKHRIDDIQEYAELERALAEADTSELDKTGKIKAAREAARSVLPNCTETKVVTTANIRAWRHFLEMRGSAGADAEIRKLAFAVHEQLLPIAPGCFGDFTYTTARTGVMELVSGFHKV